MNEVFENNAAITSIRNFYMNYRKVILGIAGLAILIISAYLINNQIAKMNNLEAAEIYNKWIAQETDTDEGILISEELFADLISSYKKTGYANIALLNHASLKAKNIKDLRQVNIDGEYLKFLFDDAEYSVFIKNIDEVELQITLEHLNA